ncbi:MAG TPA: 6-phosphogluconolactonase, partial [Acidimicrobiales bacterium]
MFGELRVVDDVAGAFAAEVIAAYGGRAEEDFSIAVSGGNTARECYDRLARDADDHIDWWNVDVYWGDERCVPSDSPDSNERLVREALLEKVGAAHAVHPMRCEEGPDRYQLLIGEVGRLDLIHLGVGPDGHTASLFPGSPALDADPGRLVTMNHDPSGRNPFERMTLTQSGISRGRLVVLTVAGESKREAMQAIADGADLPAARVRADRVVWLVD